MVAPAGPPSAPAAPAAPPGAANAGEKSDFVFIAKASAGILAVGVPWWFLTQVRDDGEFRMWLEDTQPSFFQGLRDLFPSYVPHDRAACYRAAQLPAEGAAAGGDPGVGANARAPAAPGAAVPLLVPSAAAPLGLRTALGSLETAATLRGEVLPHAEAAWAHAAAGAAQAALRHEAGEVTHLHLAAAQARERQARQALEHAQRVLQGWAGGAARHTWRAQGVAAAPSGGMWGWGTTTAAAAALGESSLAADGGDEARPEVWQGSPPRVRAFVPGGEAAAMGDRLALLRSGGRLRAEVEEAERARPPPPPPPAPSQPVPFYEEIGGALKTFFLGEGAGGKAEDMPALVEEGEGGGGGGGGGGGRGGRKRKSSHAWARWLRDMQSAGTQGPPFRVKLSTRPAGSRHRRAGWPGWLACQCHCWQCRSRRTAIRQ